MKPKIRTFWRKRWYGPSFSTWGSGHSYGLKTQEYDHPDGLRDMARLHCDRDEATYELVTEVATPIHSDVFAALKEASAQTTT
jgi:hypothetical protein